INVAGSDLLADTTIDASVAATDAAGNPATGSTTHAHTTDIAASATITVNNVTADNIINAAEGASAAVPVTGTVGGDAKAGDTVTLVVNGHTYTGTVGAGLTYSINVAGSDLLADTTIDASVAATDAAGNPATGSTTHAHTTDIAATIDIQTIAGESQSPIGMDANNYATINASDKISGFNVSGITTGVEAGQGVIVQVLNSSNVVVATLTNAIIAADGSWNTTVPANASWIIDGASYSFKASVMDIAGNNATDTDKLNALAIINGTATGSVVEAGGVNNGTAGTPSASGTLTISDADSGQSSFQTPASLAGTYGTFTFNSTSGAWTYTLDNTKSATQGLTVGQVVHDTLSVTSLDGTASQTINVTVTGSNDNATITGTATGSVTEDVAVTSGNLTASGTLSVNDVDVGQAVFQTPATLNGTYGTFIFNTTSGAWTYSASNSQSAIQSLGAGQTLTDTISVKSADGTATQAITVTINGTNDAPTATNDSIITILEDLNNTTNVYTVSINDFGTYSDVENNPLVLVRIDALPTNGMFYLNGTAITAGTVITAADISNGKLTFDPTNNTDADSSFTFSVNDGTNWSTSTYTTSVVITAVADIPTVSINGSAYVTQTIDISNVATTTNGFTITAYNASGIAGTISTHSTYPTGFGVAGDVNGVAKGANAKGDSTEIQYDTTLNKSESIDVKFDNAVSSIDVSFAWQNSSETVEVQFYSNGVLVGTSTYYGGTDLIDIPKTLAPTSGSLFNEVVFSAPAVGDDYLIHSISFEKLSTSTSTVTTNDNSTVTLNVAAALTDNIDGSETLATQISGIPVGYTITDGVHSFTATAGSTTANVTGWTLSALQLDVPANASGSVTLTATATATETSNGSNASASATFNIDVVLRNAAPTTADVNTTGNEDTLIPITLNGSDIDGTVASFVVTTLPTHGLLYADAAMTVFVTAGSTITATGNSVTLYFQPDANWNTPYGGNVTPSFDYYAVDNQGAISSTATATITVASVNDGVSIATNDSFFTTVNTSITITEAQLLSNDTLVDHAALTSVNVTGVTNGTLVDNGNGTYTFNPSSVGTGTFTYTLTDDNGETSTATVTLGTYPAGTVIQNVYESGLAIGSTPGDTSTPIIQTGTLGSITQIVVNGTTYALTASNSTITTPYGHLVINNTGTYTYTLDHPVNNSTQAGATPTDYAEIFTATKTAGGTTTLDMIIHDDTPSATPGTVIIPESTLPSYNIVLTLDCSGSMLNAANGGEVKDGNGNYSTRMEMAQNSLKSLVSEYFSQTSSVGISIVLFATNTYTMNGGNAYTTLSSALAAIDSIASTTVTSTGATSTNNFSAQTGNTTNYASALTATETAMGSGTSGSKNIIYFVSDGAPTAGDTSMTPETNYQTWLSLSTNAIDSYAIGIGTGITNTTYLDLIHNVDSLGDGVIDPAIMVPELSSLESTLLSTVPPSFGGNLLEASGHQTVTFGADGGYISKMTLSLDSNGDGVADTDVTFTYNKTAGTITSDHSTITGWTTLTASSMTLGNTNGFTHGSVVFNFTTGDYTIYTQGTASAGTTFNLNFVVTDNDTDTTSTYQTIEIVNGKPIANNDTDTLFAKNTSLSGNVITGEGTDGGLSLGNQVTQFVSQGSGVDHIIDNAVVTSMSFHGVSYTLGSWSGSTFTAANSSGSGAGYTYTITNGQLTWNATSGGQQLVFNTDGYYKYTPPTVDVPTQTLSALTAVSLTTAANVTAGGLTLEGLTATDTSATVTYNNTITTTQSFTNTTNYTNATTAGVTLSAKDYLGGTAAILSTPPATGTGTGIGIDSTGTTTDNTSRVDKNETMTINFSTAMFPVGVTNPSITLTVNTAGNIVYKVYDTAGVQLGSTTTVAASTTLNLSGYSNVGSVSIQATTAAVQVKSVTYSEIGAGVSGGVAGVNTLESLVINFNHATYAAGVTNVTLTASRADTFTYTIYSIDGTLLGQTSSAGKTFTTDPSYTNIGQIVVTAASDTTTSTVFSGVTFQSVTNNATATAVDGTDVTYTLTDSTGDQSSAMLHLNVVSNDYVGTSGNDTITGSTGNDSISGLAGDDTIHGGTGNDIINGGDGNDTLYGDAGNDIITGGAGNDVIYGGDGNDTIDGGAGSDALYGDAGNDRITYDAADSIIDGGIGIDTLILNSGTSIDFSGLNSANDTLTNFEIIDLKPNGDHHLTNLSLQDVIDITGTTAPTHDLVILGDMGDQVTLQTNATHSDWYKSGTATVLDSDNIAHDVNVYQNHVDPTVTVKIEQVIDQHLV
ncbi:MAG: VCBS domain-containing protein, partial [Sulfuricurvum sp.]|nr:VCBS domain-containing protein [Sulfuricurvum sp.]